MQEVPVQLHILRLKYYITLLRLFQDFHGHGTVQKSQHQI